MPAELMIKGEIDEAIRALNSVRRDQLPYAISLAVNWTALSAQRDIRTNVRQAFILRKPTFILNTIKIEKYDFANKRTPWTFRVKVDDGRYKGGTTRDLLAKFEDGGTRLRNDPTFPFAIPSTNARPNVRDLVPRNMFPTALRLVASRGVVGSFKTEGGKRKKIFGTLPALQKRTKRGILQWRGKRRTFVLDPREHMGVAVWGVYQRTGPKDQDVQLLWTYKQRLPIPARLRFVKTAEETVRRETTRNFERAYARAVATAR